MAVGEGCAKGKNICLSRNDSIVSNFLSPIPRYPTAGWRQEKAEAKAVARGIAKLELAILGRHVPIGS
jgi:hypothetical protein